MTDTFEAVQAKSLLLASEKSYCMVSNRKLTTFCDELSEGELLVVIPRLRWYLKAAEIGLDAAKD